MVSRLRPDHPRDPCLEEDDAIPAHRAGTRAAATRPTDRVPEEQRSRRWRRCLTPSRSIGCSRQETFRIRNERSEALVAAKRQRRLARLRKTRGVLQRRTEKGAAVFAQIRCRATIQSIAPEPISGRLFRGPTTFSRALSCRSRPFVPTPLPDSMRGRCWKRGVCGVVAAPSRTPSNFVGGVSRKSSEPDGARRFRTFRCASASRSSTMTAHATEAVVTIGPSPARGRVSSVLRRSPSPPGGSATSRRCRCTPPPAAPCRRRSCGCASPRFRG